MFWRPHKHVDIELGAGVFLKTFNIFVDKCMCDMCKCLIFIHFPDHVVLSKKERNEQRRQELRMIKKKYGLQVYWADP